MTFPNAQFARSTLAAVLGVGAVVAGPHLWRGGVIIILGALAYLSCKCRHLGLQPNSFGRRLSEYAVLLSIVAIVVLQHDVLARMSDDPAQNVLIPGWVMAAYTLQSRKRTPLLLHEAAV
jgi:hypothetical protein